MPLNLHRVLADKEMFMALKADHEITRCNASDPRIGMDANNAGIEMLAGLRIPTRVKGRIKGEAVIGDFDGGDFDHDVCRVGVEIFLDVSLFGSRQSIYFFTTAEIRYSYTVHIVLKSIYLSTA